MSEFGAYAALAAFPIIGILVFPWWDSGWAIKHHSMTLPPDIARKEEEVGRPLQLVKYGLLLLALRGIASNRLWHIVPFAVRSHSWIVLVAPGIAGGILLLGLRSLLSSLFPGAFLSLKNEYFFRGSVGLWLAIFLVGGPVEEFWRAVCIVGLVQNDRTAFTANTLTAIAFSIAHQSGLPSRVAPGVAIAVFEFLVGLILGALFMWSGNFVVPCFANVIYYVSIFSLERRRSTTFDAHQ